MKMNGNGAIQREKWHQTAVGSELFMVSSSSPSGPVHKCTTLPTWASCKEDFMSKKKATYTL